jgi:hypothetical protein
MFVSGGARGADRAWSDFLCAQSNSLTVMSFVGHGRSVNKDDVVVELTPEQLEESVPWIEKAARSMNVHPSTSIFVKRDWWIVKDVDAVVAIGNVVNGRVQGGTGWTWQMYMEKDPVFLAWIYDQTTDQWLSWVGEWFTGSPPPLSSLGRVALIGTRELSESGRRALMSLTL